MIEYLVAQYTRKNKHVVAETDGVEEDLLMPVHLHRFLELAGTHGWSFVTTTECVDGDFIDPMLETWIFQREK